VKNFRWIVYLLILFSLIVSSFPPGIQANNTRIFEKLEYPYQQSLKQSIEERNFQGMEGAAFIAQQNKSFLRGQRTPYEVLNSSWPMCCHDIRHTSLSPYNTADVPPVMKWRLQTSWVDGGIAIDDNGILYYGSNDFYMNAAYPNGTIKWRYYNGNYNEATPAIGNDGTIYFAGWNCYLYAYAPDGTQKWNYDCGSTISYGSPTIAPDGTIYVTTMDPKNLLVAVNPNGTEKWRYQTGQWMTSAPAIGSDGTIFFGSTDTYIYAVNPNGTLRWRYKTGDYVMGSASIAADGTVYIASWDGYLYALNPVNGSLFWRHAINYGSKSNPAIGPDGTIYIGESFFYAINPNGTERWSYNIGGAIHWSSPAISADGIIYVGTWIGDGNGGSLLALNSNGTERWRQHIANYWVDSSPSIGSDGTVYIGCAYDAGGGYLYAFGLGPLIADAHGPYTGYYNTAINFTGDAFGGIPSYSYHWDFGDGSSSNQQNPSHNYTTVGNFTATLTVTDSEGNQSSDTTPVSVTYKLPSVSITKPKNGIYLLNIRILWLPERCIVFGPITFKVQASQTPLGIDHVEFYIDGKLMATKTKAPYTWTWTTPSFSRQTMMVKAYDPMGHWASAGIKVTKLF
jgi:outer membrane protein assembly factor BamB